MKVCNLTYQVYQDERLVTVGADGATCRRHISVFIVSVLDAVYL